MKTIQEINAELDALGEKMKVLHEQYNTEKRVADATLNAWSKLYNQTEDLRRWRKILAEMQAEMAETQKSA